MIGRTAPSHLALQVHSMLAAEKAALQQTGRPRGKAGMRYDRSATYLNTMLGIPADDTPGRPASAGDIVSVRHAGDVEHRTYHLCPGTACDRSPCLPADWPFGQAVIGLKAGETGSYTSPGGTSEEFTIIAVWDGDTGSDLPSIDDTAGPEGPR